MKVFVDTSAFYALAAEEDRAHDAACQIHEHLRQSADALMTTNYVVLETISLLQRRHGVEAAERFGDGVERVQIVWMEADAHRAAWRVWKGRRLRGLSLVDCSSFEVMRRLNIQRAFAFDRQFAEAGFTVLGNQTNGVAERKGSYRASRARR